MDFNNLQSLIESDKKASEYFNSLPEYVREHISTRSQNVTSFDELKRFAENYIQGDK